MITNKENARLKGIIIADKFFQAFIEDNGIRGPNWSEAEYPESMIELVSASLAMAFSYKIRGEVLKELEDIGVASFLMRSKELLYDKAKAENRITWDASIYGDARAS